MDCSWTDFGSDSVLGSVRYFLRFSPFTDPEGNLLSLEDGGV